MKRTHTTTNDFGDFLETEEGKAFAREVDAREAELLAAEEAEDDAREEHARKRYAKAAANAKRKGHVYFVFRTHIRDDRWKFYGFRENADHARGALGTLGKGHYRWGDPMDLTDPDFIKNEFPEGLDLD